MIEELIKYIPDDMLGRSGSVFYSGRQAFAEKSALYLLGLNPGGDPINQARETVRWHTEKVLHDESPNWSAYRDESWAGSAPGTRGMQPRVLHLLNRLQLDPGQVPASNIIFVRSSRESTLRGDVSDFKERCWNFHRNVILHLQPRVIVCFGGTTGQWVCRKLQAEQQIGEFVEVNNRRWKSRAFADESGVTVVVATHPSIADWTVAATDPTPLVLEALNNI